jgi:hypothetical protein
LTTSSSGLRLENQDAIFYFSLSDSTVTLNRILLKNSDSTRFDLNVQFFNPEGVEKLELTSQINENPFSKLKYREVIVSGSWLQGRIQHRLILYPKGSVLEYQTGISGKLSSSLFGEKMLIGSEMVEQHRPPESTKSWVQVSPGFSHFLIKSYQMKEATDYHNSPLQERVILPFSKPAIESSNLVVLENSKNQSGIFLAKLSPIGKNQTAYPGYDWLFDRSKLQIVGAGISDLDQKVLEWSYPLLLGVGQNMEKLLVNLLSSQKTRMNSISLSFPMIMSNTWGDRSKDSRMNAAFIANEIRLAQQLGINYVQLDDGWQAGLSKNSANKSGKVWDDWSNSDWNPHPDRFPGGLEPVVKQADSLGVSLGLWFNPSKVREYEKWQRDAELLKSFHQRYGVKQIKIDGLELQSGQSEKRIKEMLRNAILDTSGRLSFNLDVTAGNRLGYLDGIELGTLFLENRYTDWGNYFPHWTLRNLWQLGKIIPVQRIQAEFLNVQRNKNQYDPNDPLSPSNVGISYAFGVAAAAQPLAWMELSQLPKEDFWLLQKEIQSYLKWGKLYSSGTIIPIGNRPTGFEWTGFQSFLEDGSSIIIIYRENHPESNFQLELSAPFSEFEILHGKGNLKLNSSGSRSKLEITIDHPMHYMVFRLIP